MAISDTWDATLPPDSENPTLGANRIRELKRAIFERMDQLGADWPDGTDAASGQLTCGVQGTTGVLELAYEADGDVLLQLNDDTAAADASTLIVGTGIGGARDYTVEAEVLSAARATLSEHLILPGIVSKVFSDSPYQMLTESIVLANGTSGDLIIDLPLAGGAEGRVVIIKNIGAVLGTVIVRRTGADNIRIAGAGSVQYTDLEVAASNSLERTGIILVATTATLWDVIVDLTNTNQVV